jgi:hypothetical protein
MHLMVGDDLHGIVRRGQVVLVPCRCPGLHLPFYLPETRLPAAMAAFFPIAIPVITIESEAR